MNKTSSTYREKRFCAPDDLSLYYREYGPAAGPEATSKPPLLCLPGLTRNSRDFHDLAMRLSSDRRVVCPDLRGRGRSAFDPDYRNYRPDVYVADIVALLAAADLHDVVLVGTSLGGILSMILAASVPTAIKGVVLNDIGPEVGGSGASRIGGYVGKPLFYPNFEAAAGAMRTQYLNAYPDFDDDQWMDMARKTFTDHDTEEGVRLDYDMALGDAFREQASKGEVPDLWPYYKSLRHIPTICVRGELSDILTQETFDLMAVEKPDLVRVSLANRGHVPLLDEPEFVSAFDEFLARL